MNNISQKNFRYFLIFLVLFFTAWSLRATLLYSLDLSFEREFERRAYAETIKFVFWVAAPMAFLILVENIDPVRQLKLASRPDLRGMAISSVAFIAFCFLTLAVEYFARQRTLDFSLGVVSVLVGVAVSPVSEEILFRGFILGQMSSRMRFVAANVIVSLLFVAVHWPHWIWANGFQPWIPVTSTSIFILSLLLGWMVKKSNSLYPAIAAHIINNLISALLRP